MEFGHFRVRNPLKQFSRMCMPPNPLNPPSKIKGLFYGNPVLHVPSTRDVAKWKYLFAMKISCKSQQKPKTQEVKNMTKLFGLKKYQI